MKINKYLKYSIIINLILVTLLLISFDITYETNDDFYISMLLSNTFSNSNFSIYNGLILTNILSLLYSIINNINWYIVLMYILMFISSISIIYRLLKKDKFTGIIFSIIFIFFIMIDLYVNIQYTMTSALMTIAGSMLLFNKETNKIEIIIGIILIFFGMSYRLVSSLMAITPFIAYLVYKTIFYQGSLISNIKKVGLAITVILLVILTNNILVNINDYNEVLEHDSARISVQDYKMLEYSENKDYYDSINVTDSKIKLIENWMNDVDDTFNTKSYNLISTIKQSNFNLYNLKEALKYTIDFFISDYNNMIKLLYISLVIIFIFISNKSRLFTIINFLFTFIMTYYFYYIHRFPDRVIFTLLIISILSLLYSYNSSYQFRSKKVSIFIVVLLSLSYSFNFLTNYHLMTKNLKEHHGKTKILDILTEYDDYKFIIDQDVFTPELVYTAFETPFDKLSDNVLFLGGWFVEHPGYKNYLESINVKSIVDTLINDKAYVLTLDYDRALLLQNYINDTYKLEKGYYKLEYAGWLVHYPIYKVIIES